MLGGIIVVIVVKRKVSVGWTSRRSILTIYNLSVGVSLYILKIKLV